jgi:4-carboxymuconolactone decarboxylase
MRFLPTRVHAALAATLALAIMSPSGAAEAEPDPRVARGEAVLGGLTKGRPQPTYEAMRRDFPFLADATAGFALGDVWGREELDVRTRQLAAMAAFGALGLRPFFKIHAGYALDAGVKPQELKEIVYLLTVPAGFPRAIEASQALREVLAEKGLAAP